MRIARETKGVIYGGSIISYFKRKEGIVDFINELDKTGNRNKFTELLFDITFQPNSFKNRTSEIRDIDIIFESQEEVDIYMNNLQTLPGITRVLLTNHISYRNHIIFDKLFEVSKYKIFYTYDFSFTDSNKGKTICIFIDIVIPKQDKHKIPCHVLQYFSHKQLTWDKHGVHAPKSHTFKSDDFDTSHTIINNFLKGRVSLSGESDIMTSILSDLVSEIDSSNITKKGEIYTRILISRSVFILRVLVLMKMYDVYNSPLKTDKNKDCGICFEHKNDIMYKWTSTSTPYCLECLTSYIRNICDYKLVYNNPSDICIEMLDILDDSDVCNLTKSQVYLIENILICPVGNKLDFSIKHL
jgi:hypothetical protein